MGYTRDRSEWYGNYRYNRNNAEAYNKAYVLDQPDDTAAAQKYITECNEVLDEHVKRMSAAGRPMSLEQWRAGKTTIVNRAFKRWNLSSRYTAHGTPF